MTSSRADGGGHWPKGKPRNGPLTVPDSSGHPSVASLLKAVWAKADTLKRKEQLAAYLGVTSSAVYKWQAGTNQMTQSNLDRVAKWLTTKEE